MTDRTRANIHKNFEKRAEVEGDISENCDETPHPTSSSVPVLLLTRLVADLG